jgi:hypothetical protein
MTELARAARETDSRASGSKSRLEHDRVTKFPGTGRRVGAAAKHARFRTWHTTTGETAPQAGLVGCAPNRNGPGPQQRFAVSFDERRHPLQAPVGFGCDEPYGVGGCDQVIQEPLDRGLALATWINQMNFDAGAGREREPHIGGRHYRMAVQRNEICDER